MKKSLNILFLCFFLFSVTVPGKAWSPELPEPYLVKHFNFKPNLNVVASSSGGNIQVIGTNSRRASVAVLVTDREGNYDKAAAKKAMQHYSIEIREEKNTIYASAKPKKNLNGNRPDLLISFRISVPKKVNCTLNSGGGAISLYNLKGNSEANTSGGDIGLCWFTGDLKAETGGGAINVNEAEGSLQLNSLGGCINLKKVAGDIQARSGGGSISADIRKLGKYLTLETEEGSLKALIPGTQGLNVDLTGMAVKADEADFKGTSDRKKIKGLVNGGGIPIKLHSASGNTELRYRS